MSLTESIILISFIIFAVVIIVGLSRSIMLSSQQGGVFYQNLEARVKLLRMGKMLGALGINTSSYARTHPVNEIELHMSRCRSCSNTSQCDSELATGQVPQADEYCPNNKDMLKGTSINP